MKEIEGLMQRGRRDVSREEVSKDTQGGPDGGKKRWEKAS